MARNKGQFAFAANFEVKAAAALDPRVAVATKAELISKETWPYDGDTIYLYKGILVSVQEENAVYMLIDYDKITSADYSGWLRVDAGNAEQVEVINNLTSDSTTAALSAKQGKVLMTKITTVEKKLTGIYTYKGTVGKYVMLPTTNAPGAVYNVVEAYGGYPAGTNWAWTGTEWDALGGNIDLSNYYSKIEVDDAISVETERAIAEEERLAGLIAANNTLATKANDQATDNKTALNSLSVTVGGLNLLLNGNDNPDDNIEDQIGLVGRLKAVEELIGEPSDEDKTPTMLSRLNALEDLVTGGDTGEDEGDQTLLQKVNANTLAISNLQTTVGDKNSGLVKAVNTLNASADTEGSVDYKIDQAFKWIDVQ